MEKVIRMGTVPNDMLARVEDLAGMIKDGEIQSLVMIAVDKDGNVLSALIPDGSIFTLLGAVTAMQGQILNKIEVG